MSPVTDADLEEYIEEGSNKQEALEEAVNDFLRLELKFREEIEDLMIKRVTQPVKDGMDRIYLQFASEESSKYIFSETPCK